MTQNPTHGRKALNCIIDDSALLAGLRSETGDNFKHWINNGLINVYVPLYTLERLDALRKTKSTISSDAQKALQWLDHITTLTENKIVGRVELQGPNDQYGSWDEVEKYHLPSTPLSTTDGLQEVDSLSKILDQNSLLDQRRDLTDVESTGRSGSSGSSSDLSGAPESIRATLDGTDNVKEQRPPIKASALSESVANGHVHDKASPAAHETVPPRLRPLLNFVVWRTYHRKSTDQSSSIHVLLTDDPVIQRQAGKFGVRAKLLSQLRKIVSNDKQDVDDDAAIVADNEKMTEADQPNEESVDDLDDDEEKILFDPTKRPKSSAGAPTNVIDPDHFGRGLTLQSPPNKVRTRGSLQPNRGYRGPSRGRFATTGRNSFGLPTQVPTGPAASRGVHSFTRGRGAHEDSRFHRGSNQRPIDPDSYARPAPVMRRGRGPFRKIWEPN